MSRKPETLGFWCGRLPHWEVVDGRYFVTVHLRGAIPQQGQKRIHALSEQLQRIARIGEEDPLQASRRLFVEMERWLDQATHAAHLKDSRVAQMVMDAITFRQQRDWNVFEFVVMPSHVHLFLEVLRGDLKTSMEQFKRWTGHEASKLLSLDKNRFWQDEWFDHWSRSDQEDEKIVQYIRKNAAKAGLVANFYDWPYGSWYASRSREPSGTRKCEKTGSYSCESCGGDDTLGPPVPLGSRDLLRANPENALRTRKISAV